MTTDGIGKCGALGWAQRNLALAQVAPQENLGVICHKQFKHIK